MGCVLGWQVGRHNPRSQTSLKAPPGAGRRASRGLGLMGRLFPCLEVLHKHLQPCAHSHGYRWERLAVVASPCPAVAHSSGRPGAGAEQLWALAGQISARQAPSWCPGACGVRRRRRAPGQPLSPAAMGTNLPPTRADSAQADLELHPGLDPRPSPSPAHNPSSFCSPFLSQNLGPTGLLTEHSLWPSTWALAPASALRHGLSLVRAWAPGIMACRENQTA